MTSPLLDPGLALPAVYGRHLLAARGIATWPFSYEAIFQAAFAKRQDGASACPQPINSNAVMARIQAEVRLTERASAAIAKAR